jgi:hypothetical protein
VIKGQVKDCTAQMCMSLCIQSTAEILHPLVWEIAQPAVELTHHVIHYEHAPGRLVPSPEAMHRPSHAYSPR